MGSKRWSTGELLGEFKDVQATVMSLDCTGNRATFAGNRDVWLFQVSNPSRGLVKLARKSAKDDAEVSVCQCSRFLENVFALGCNEVTEIYTVDPARLVERAVLSGHSRPLSDLDWSHIEPDSLATCAADGYIMLWDLRDPRAPTAKLKSVQCPMKVKWSKAQRGHVLASSHDRDLRLWDVRRGDRPLNQVDLPLRQVDRPLRHLAGHAHRVLGIDWCPQGMMLASTGLDCSVFVWDTMLPQSIDDCRVHELHGPRGAPQLHARFTPFDGCLLTSPAPQARRADYNLLLYNVDSLPKSGVGIVADAVEQHTFIGHNDVVYDFHWREATGSSCYQLIAWSRDQTLRMWNYEAPVGSSAEPMRQSLGSRLLSNGTASAAAAVNCSDSSRLPPLDTDQFGAARGDYTQPGPAPLDKSTLRSTSVSTMAGVEALFSSGTSMPQLADLPTAFSSSALPVVGISASSLTAAHTGNPERTTASATFDLGPSQSLSSNWHLLQSEIDSLGDMEGVRVTDVDAERASCTVVLDCSRRHGEHSVRARISFPPNYPAAVEQISVYVEPTRSAGGASVADGRLCQAINVDLDRAANSGNSLALAAVSRRPLETSLRVARQRLDELLGCGAGSGGELHVTSAIASRGPTPPEGGTIGDGVNDGSGGGGGLRRSASTLLANAASSAPAMSHSSTGRLESSNSLAGVRCSGATFSPSGMLVTFYRSSSSSKSGSGVVSTANGTIGSLTRSVSQRPFSDLASTTSLSSSVGTLPSVLSAPQTPSAFRTSMSRTLQQQTQQQHASSQQQQHAQQSSQQAMPLLHPAPTHHQASSSLLSRSPKSTDYDMRSLERAVSSSSSYRRSRDDWRRGGSSSNSAAASAAAAAAAAAAASARRDRSSIVVICDVSHSLPISRALATRYVVAADSRSPALACQRNTDVARDEGRSDLVQLWKLLACVAAASSRRRQLEEEQQLLEQQQQQPLPTESRSSASLATELYELEEASQLVWPIAQDIVAHYETLLDVQTLAMICCSVDRLVDDVKEPASDYDVPVAQLPQQLRGTLGGRASSAGSPASRLLGTRAAAASQPPPPPVAVAASAGGMSQSLVVHSRCPSEPSSSTNLESFGSDAANNGGVTPKTRHSESLSSSLEPELRLSSYRSSASADDETEAAATQYQQQPYGTAVDESVRSGVFSPSSTGDALSPDYVVEAGDSFAPAVGTSLPLRLDSFVATYAEQLLCWGQMNARARLLHGLSLRSPFAPASSPELTVRIGCSMCGSEWLGGKYGGSSRSAEAPVSTGRPAATAAAAGRREACSCSSPMPGSGGLGGVAAAVVRCCLCHIPVKGCLLMCHICGHGGHLQHMTAWYERKDMCPTGCGCVCLSHKCNLPWRVHKPEVVPQV